MSNGISFTCDSCGREVLGCNIVNGMKFCAKCYQETFGTSKDCVLLDKDKKIADLEAKLAEKDAELEKWSTQYARAYVNRQNDLIAKNNQLKQQLHDLPKKIVGEIKKELYDCGKTYLEDEPYIEICIVKGILDTILKKYGGEENGKSNM